mgnify:CR=1 FL=1
MSYQIEEITNEEIDLLFEALDAINKLDQSGNAMIQIFGSLLVGDDKEARARQQADLQRHLAEEATTKRHRNYRIMVLKAKLARLALARQSDGVDFNELLEKS